MDVVTLIQMLDEELSSPMEKPQELLIDDDLFEGLFVLNSEASSEALNKELKDYLQREVHILTLVREKQKKKIARMSEKKLLDIFKSDVRNKKYLPKDKCFDYLMRVIGNAFVKPELAELAVEIRNQEDREIKSDSARQCLEAILGPAMEDISLDMEPTALERSVLKFYAKKDGDYVDGLGLTNKAGMRICLCLNGWLNSRKREVPFKWSKIKSKETAIVTDLYGLAEMVFIRELDQIFQRHIQEVDENALMDDCVYHTMMDDVVHEVSAARTPEGTVIIDKDAVDVEFLDFLKRLGYQYQISDTHVECDGRWIYGFPIWKKAVCAPFLPGFPRVFYSYDDGSEDMRRYRDGMRNSYMKLFFLLQEEYITEKEDARFRSEQKSAARVFQTKKNIPEKYLNVMRSSVLNNTFGYVELDEDCDLVSFRIIEKEFLALQNLCFGNEQTYKNVAIRFRKLGRHRAAGLYFPSLLCLCVDIRYPSSFGHEHLHMVDYERGELSKGYAFLEIRERYEELLTKAVEKLLDDDPVKKKMKGRGMYNMAYYLRPTEIFARCGEMYFTCIHKVQNSLMQPSYGIEYPVEDKILKDMIEDYYSTIFPISTELSI